jgi:hypothetical protein
MTQTMALLAPATIQPCHARRPSITVERTVNTHEM